MNILICDNDEKCVEECRRKIIEISKKRQISVEIEVLSSGKDFIRFLDEKYTQIELIYLDIHMPEINGMKVAKKLREKENNADIVFYTRDATMAIEAFDVNAMHYIVKEQTSREKFEEIFLAAYQRSKKRNAEILTVSCAGEYRNIPLEDIMYFEIKKRIATVYYMENGQAKMFEFYTRSLSKIEETLWGSNFLRIHRSYLVSEKYIQKRTSKKVLMQNGHELTVGRQYSGKLREIYEKVEG